MKKTVQIAFAVALVVLSILSTVFNTELLGNVVLGIVIPSFLLTLISFIDAIIIKCKENAKKFVTALNESADAHVQKAGHLLKQPTTEDIAQKIEAEIKISAERYDTSKDYAQMTNALEKCELVLKYCNLIAYVLLFLSMILSPYIVSILSKVNLNCITLWSLTILYVESELKPEIMAKSFDLLIKHFVHHKY